NFNFTTLNLIPTTASSLWHLGKADDFGPAPAVLAFNVFTPNNLNVESRIDLRTNSAYYFSQSNKLILVGPAFAYRLHRRFSLGVAVWGAVNLYSATTQFTDSREQRLDGINTFITAFTTEESQNAGLLGSIGARYD